MKTRTLIIIFLVALLGSYLYIKVIWGGVREFLDFTWKCSLIGVVCLVVILLATLIISKIKK